jgi:integrase
MEQPSQKRHDTGYPGVKYRIRNRRDGKGTERVYYVRYKRPGDKKSIEDRVGSQADGMTPSRAAGIRHDRMHGREPGNAQKRRRRRWTFDNIWAAYWRSSEQSPNGITDLHKNMRSYYINHLQPHIGHLTPDQVTQRVFDDMHVDIMTRPKYSAYAARMYDQAVDRGDHQAALAWGEKLKRQMDPLAPASVYNVIQGLRSLGRYAIYDLQCAAMPCKIRIRRPGGKEIELLTIEQVGQVLRTCNAWPDRVAGYTMRIALFSGIRHMAIYKLVWRDINFDIGIITLRGGKARDAGERDYIPLNQPTRELMKEIMAWSKYTGADDPVLPNRKGGHWQRPRTEALRKLADACGLPAGFRPVHGMRHVFATMALANGAELTDIQKLLCHKNYNTTLIYTHHKMDNLRAVSNNITDTIDQALGQNVRKLKSVK